MFACLPINAKNPVRRCTLSPDIDRTPAICRRPPITSALYSSRKHWSVSGHVHTRDRVFFFDSVLTTRTNKKRYGLQQAATVTQQLAKDKQGKNIEPRKGVHSAPTLIVHLNQMQLPPHMTARYPSRKRWSVSGHVHTRDRIFFPTLVIDNTLTDEMFVKKEPRIGVHSAPLLIAHQHKL